MIVKNEEEMLPRSLKSIRHLVDEIIVVDTGSTDRTIEIACSLGAKVYLHPWQNDFGKHKNQAINYARGDWFIIIDADEELDASQISKEHLKQELVRLSSEVHSLALTLKDRNKKGEVTHTFKVPRLFRRGVGIRYEGAIHEQPTIRGRVGNSDMVLNHYGYDLDMSRMDKKFEMTKFLLLERVKEDPQDHDAYFYLCMLLAPEREIEKGIEYGKKCLEILPETDDCACEFYYSLYFIIGMGYLRLNDSEKALKWIRKGLEVFPDDVDLNAALTEIGVHRREDSLILEGGLKYMEVVNLFRKRPQIANTRFLYTLDGKYEDIIQYRLMMAYLRTSQLEKAEEIWQRIQMSIMGEPEWQREYLLTLSEIDNENVLQEKTFLFLKNSPGSLFLVAPLINAALGKDNFHHIYNQLLDCLPFSDEQRSLSIFIGAMLMERGCYGLAVDVLEPLCSCKKTEDHVLANLALAYDRSGRDGEADRTYRIGMEAGIDLGSFLMNAIHYFEKKGDRSAMELSLHRLLEQCSDFKDLPDDILLLLAEHLLKNGQMDYFILVSLIALQRGSDGKDQEIRDVKELAHRYDHVSDSYRKKGQLGLALRCLQIGERLTDSA